MLTGLIGSMQAFSCQVNMYNLSRLFKFWLLHDLRGEIILYTIFQGLSSFGFCMTLEEKLSFIQYFKVSQVLAFA